MAGISVEGDPAAGRGYNLNDLSSHNPPATVDPYCVETNVPNYLNCVLHPQDGKSVGLEHL